MDTVDWRQARQWLIDTGVIPPTHRVTKPDVTLLDFARSLRDGVFLCSLLNKLKPGTVEYTARPVMQHSYLNNINAFLNACKLEFKIIEDDLFTDSELYDVDNFSKVMSTLSKLSYTQEALSRGWKPFPSDDNRDYYNDPSNGQDIYASLQDVSAQTAVYANISDLYQDSFTEEDSFGYGDEKIYDSVLRYQAKPLTDANTQDEQRLAILKELYETERSFSEVLQVIAEDYYDILKDHCPEDLRVLFDAAQKVLPFHKQLRDGLEKCANPKPNSGDVDVANCFFDVEDGFLHYGVYAAVLPEATEKAKLLQNQRDTSRLMQTTMEKSQSRFSLSDILPVPIQRIMRYPLLIKELEKCAKKASLPNQVLQMEQLIGLLEDIAKYINITKGDYDTVRTIEELESNLVEYKGPKLSLCGRYHMDGELRIKHVEGGKDKEEPKSRWVFLFDKVILITNRKQRFLGVKYIVKSYHDIAAMSVETISAIRNRGMMFGFRLKVDGKGNIADSKEYMAIAKTEQLKTMWTAAVKQARDIIRPVAGKKSHHSFEYFNFDSARKCSCCQKLLHGSYFQGYQCSECGAVSHRDCLSLQSTCSAARHPRPPLHSPLIPQNSLDTGIQRWRTTRDETPIVTGSKRTYVATQRYIPFGHRRETYLNFEKGDEIDIINNNDPEKWEGIHSRSGMRGFVSPHYLIRKPQILPSVSLPGGTILPDPNPSPRNKRMADYPWYIGRKTRIDAEVALHRQRDGVFLIRESMDRPGEYAVALRWNNMPKHIKIMKNFQTEKLYVSDACDFHTVIDLVEYYHKNTLGQSFPGVDTTLRFPYLDVIEGRVPAAFGERRHHSLTSTSGIPPPSFPAPLPHGHIPPPTISPPSHSMNSWNNDVIGEALCDFNGDGPGQLSFFKHEVVRVLSKDTKKLGWWRGECNGRTGIFRTDHIYIKDAR